MVTKIVDVHVDPKDAWDLLGRMKWYDFYCAYAGASSNVVVRCRGVGCHKFGMKRDALGHTVFMGCSDRLPFSSNP